MFRRIKQLAFPLAILLVGGMLGGAFNARYVAPQVESGIVDVTNLPQAEIPPPGFFEGLGIPAAQAQFTIDVTRRGAIGNGTTDDATAFQLAATALVNTGGVIWLPPNLKYKINSSIDIRSYYPIWIVSQMGTSAGLVNPNVHTKTGLIIPGAAITNGLFRWRKPAAAASDADTGGGGMVGITIADVNLSTNATRAVAVDMAINLEHVVNWVGRDLTINYVKGSALKCSATGAVVRLDNVRISSCGDTSKPSVWNLTSNLYGDLVYIEEAYTETALDCDSGGIIYWNRGYFENTQAESHLDADGAVHVNNTLFMACAGTNMAVLRGLGSSMDRCRFVGTPTGTTLSVDDGQMQFSNLYFNTANTGDAINLTANALQCTFDHIYAYNSGSLDFVTPGDARVSNVFVLASTAADATYSIDMGNGNLVGATVNGGTTQVADGIRCAAGSITDAEVSGLNNANGITTTSAVARVFSLRCSSLNGGTEFSFTAGTRYVGLSDSSNNTEHTASALTIASGVATKLAWKRAHTLTGEGGMADDLVTLNGGVEGDRITLRRSGSVTITLKHGTGNLFISGNADFALDSSNDLAECYHNGTGWIVTPINGGT